MISKKVISKSNHSALRALWLLLLICQKVVLIWRKKCADLRFVDFSFSTDEKVLMCLFYWWESTNVKLFLSTPTESTTLRTYLRVVDKSFRQKKQLLMEAISLYDEANKINIVLKEKDVKQILHLMRPSLWKPHLWQICCVLWKICL